MATKASQSKRWVWVGAYMGFWTLLALVFAAQAYVSQLVFDKPIAWDLAVRRSFKEWYAYGLVALGVLWLCKRLKVDSLNTPRWLLKHVAAAPVFAVTHVALISWLLAGEVSVQTGEVLTFGLLFKKMAIHYVIMNMTMYWVVVCAYWGWHYFKQFKERELQTAQLQRELSESRLSALRMELNPHFLFNTLHTVSALIHSNPDAAERVVARLSTLLRSTLDQSKPQEVSLTEEMRFLEKYLEIEKTRFEDRLNVRVDIPPETEQALVPYLILQPIVENAIRHGIEPKDAVGNLHIQASRHNGSLELEVTDDGKGVELTNGLPPREGIGLSNTRSRLRHLYGEEHNFELVGAPEGGLKVRIKIPYRTASSAN